MPLEVKTSIHAAVWGPDWSADAIGPTLESAARAGYDHVVIPLRRFEDIVPRRLARAFEQCGLAPLNACGLAPDRDIGAADPAIRERGVSHLCHAVALARDMGSTQIGGVLYGPLAKAGEPVTDDAFARAADAMRRVAEVAQAAGVRLALEVVNRYETALLYNTARGLAFLDAVAHDNVYLHLDTFHMSIDEAAPFAALQAALPRLAYFELDQSHRGAPFEGSLDLADWARRASAAGYRGIVGVEAFSRSKLAPDHANALAVWEDHFSDGDLMAVEFMRIIRAAFEA
ncbi:sugar phosphate isomerase/epimerase family protein [Variovorax sp. PBL-E5]|uniref:sugar phosphate isomerase/epimerase family protein n=1 Tax=Variovorax sp. PBL-E5 TaxID=434014 RepID=UPI0013173A33|nr:sugar phosphate isomerase/epimerase family protein [Variovorax sp. PBL-E5]VTU30185.1 D-tagatose 3-epimerase [Variovorax sp. PBL-E5]